MVKWLSIALVVLFLSGCATVELSEEGRDIQILTEVPGYMSPDGYKDVGEVSCSKGANLRSPKTNIIQCRNDLRNEAAELGADFLVVQHQQLGQPGSGAGEYAIGGCTNCIVMVGTAYKRLDKSQQ